MTSNVEALLAENDALRREVARLQRELERWQRGRSGREQTSSTESSARVRPAQVQAWGTAPAAQPGWTALRQSSLNALVDQLNRAGFPAHMTLQQRLDRLAPGLGRDLMAAIGPRASKKTAAVLAAFALYWVRASEWLDEDPQRVVADLRQRVPSGSTSGSGPRSRNGANNSQGQQDSRGEQNSRGQQNSRGRRTRSDRRRSDRVDDAPPRDSRAAALAVLGLQADAGPDAIKAAFRQLVKRHHPDVGGSADAFRRVSEAYQQLIS